MQRMQYEAGLMNLLSGLEDSSAAVGVSHQAADSPLLVVSAIVLLGVVLSGSSSGNADEASDKSGRELHFE